MTGVFLLRRRTAPRRQSHLCLELDWALRSLRAALYCNVWNSLFTQAMKTTNVFASMSSHIFWILSLLTSENRDSNKNVIIWAINTFWKYSLVVLCGICNLSRRPTVFLHDFFSHVRKCTLFLMLFDRLMSCPGVFSFLSSIALCFSSFSAILFPLWRDSARPCKTGVTTTYSQRIF